MSQNNDESGLNLEDPKILAALENVVFNKIEAVPAKHWLASLALLLVAKQEDEEAIEMNLNGIRVQFRLLPPGEDYDGKNDLDPETYDAVEKEVI